MTNNTKDLQIIEDSRLIHEAHNIIMRDIRFLQVKCAEKKIKVKIECHFQDDEVVRFQLYSHNDYAFPNFNGVGKSSFWQSHYSHKNYDQAFNQTREMIRNVEGDVSELCAPWFDMSVYSKNELKALDPINAALTKLLS